MVGMLTLRWCNGWRAHLESEVDDKMHILANQILKNQKCKMIEWKTNMWNICTVA